MPKLWPAPFIAHQRSEDASMVRRLPLARTTFMETNWSATSPWWPWSHPWPPPRAGPSRLTHSHVPVTIKQPVSISDSFRGRELDPVEIYLSAFPPPKARL